LGSTSSETCSRSRTSCEKAGTRTPFFYDTYAVLAYLSGNKRYARYFEKETGHLTVLNLMETYYAVLRDYGEVAAEKAYSATAKYAVEFRDEDVKDGMKKRLALRKKRLDLSYADALGYAVSLRLRLKFLTGDEAFKDLENVEFVK